MMVREILFSMQKFSRLPAKHLLYWIFKFLNNFINPFCANVLAKSTCVVFGWNIYMRYAAEALFSDPYSLVAKYIAAWNQKLLLRAGYNDWKQYWHCKSLFSHVNNEEMGGQPAFPVITGRGAANEAVSSPAVWVTGHRGEVKMRLIHCPDFQELGWQQGVFFTLTQAVQLGWPYSGHLANTVNMALSWKNSKC